MAVAMGMPVADSSKFKDEELGGTRVDEGAHDHRIPPRMSCLRRHESECDAKRDIPHQNRESVACSLSEDRVVFHGRIVRNGLPLSSGRDDCHAVPGVSHMKKGCWMQDSVGLVLHVLLKRPAHGICSHSAYHCFGDAARQDGQSD